MSRVGKYPVVIKDGVVFSLKDNVITAKGKKGELSLPLPKGAVVECKDKEVVVSPLNDTIHARKDWGTTRALINNMLIGVSEGFKVSLVIEGVGYRASVQGKNLVLQLGFSHDVVFPIPSDVKITCADQSNIAIEGINKQIVGQVAAKIRAFKKPEPYKGKGIKYSNEVILRKEGKKK